jgi:hypothetical protein
LLGIADGLLALALDFLNHAFAFQPIGAGGFADALFGLADRFIGRALDLVFHRTHGNLLWRVKLREDKSALSRKFRFRFCACARISSSFVGTIPPKSARGRAFTTPFADCGVGISRRRSAFAKS